MRVHWTQTAVGHLRAIRDYIARNAPGYAVAVVDRIVRRTDQLAGLPHNGAEVPEYGDETIRELLEHPYRILYRVTAEQIEILAVIHAARRLPRNPPR